MRESEVIAASSLETGVVVMVRNALLDEGFDTQTGFYLGRLRLDFGSDV